MTGAVAAGLYPDHRSAARSMCGSALTLEPRPDAHAVYMKKYGLYTSILESMSPCWDRMQRVGGEIRGAPRPPPAGS
jgi:ribulose kinase